MKIHTKFNIKDFTIRATIQTKPEIIEALQPKILIKLYHIVNTYGKCLLANSKSFTNGDISLSLNDDPQTLIISRTLQMFTEKNYNLLLLENNMGVHIDKNLNCNTLNDFIRKIEKNYKIDFSKIFNKKEKINTSTLNRKKQRSLASFFQNKKVEK